MKYEFDFEKAIIGCPVVTRNGIPVKILDANYNGAKRKGLVVKAMPCDEYERVYFCDKHGRHVNDPFSNDPNLDLFLADNDYHWDELKMIHGKSIERLADEQLEMTKVPEYSRNLTEFEKMVRDMLWVAYNHDDWKSNVTVSVKDNDIVIPFADKLYEFVKKELEEKKPKGPTVAEFASKLLETIPNDAVVISNGIHYIENENVVRFENK